MMGNRLRTVVEPPSKLAAEQAAAWLRRRLGAARKRRTNRPSAMTPSSEATPSTEVADHTLTWSPGRRKGTGMDPRSPGEIKNAVDVMRRFLDQSGTDAPVEVGNSAAHQPYQSGTLIPRSVPQSRTATIFSYHGTRDSACIGREGDVKGSHFREGKHYPYQPVGFAVRGTAACWPHKGRRESNSHVHGHDQSVSVTRPRPRRRGDQSSSVACPQSGHVLGPLLAKVRPCPRAVHSPLIRMMAVRSISNCPRHLPAPGTPPAVDCPGPDQLPGFTTFIPRPSAGLVASHFRPRPVRESLLAVLIINSFGPVVVRMAVAAFNLTFATRGQDRSKLLICRPRLQKVFNTEFSTKTMHCSPVADSTSRPACDQAGGLTDSSRGSPRSGNPREDPKSPVAPRRACQPSALAPERRADPFAPSLWHPSRPALSPSKGCRDVLLL